MTVHRQPYHLVVESQQDVMVHLLLLFFLRRVLSPRELGNAAQNQKDGEFIYCAGMDVTARDVAAEIYPVREV